MKSLHFTYQLILLVSVLISCGSSGTEKTTTGTDAAGNVLRFKKYVYIDSQGTGIEGFSFLMPTDWQFDGGMQWILDNPAMPSVTAFRVFNPKGKEEFEVFANHCYFWTNNSQLLGMFPPGSKYFGSTVKQP